MKGLVNNKKGFTILELITVVAILSVLVAAASLSFDFIRRERINSTSRELFGDIQLARMNAATKSPTDVSSAGGNIAPNRRGFGIRFVSPSSYVVFDFNDTNNNFQYDGVPEEVAVDLTTKTLSTERLWVLAGAVLVPPVNNVVIFDKLGSPRQQNWSMIGGGNPSFTIAIDNPSITSYKKCITISQNSIREGYWNAVAAACAQQ